MVEPPLGSACPFRTAVVPPTLEAARVVTTGTLGVVKVKTLPWPVPAGFVASAQ